MTDMNAGQHSGEEGLLLLRGRVQGEVEGEQLAANPLALESFENSTEIRLREFEKTNETVCDGSKKFYALSRLAPATTLGTCASMTDADVDGGSIGIWISGKC
jgi:hypothetical protein